MMNPAEAKVIAMVLGESVYLIVSSTNRTISFRCRSQWFSKMNFSKQIDQIRIYSIMKSEFDISFHQSIEIFFSLIFIRVYDIWSHMSFWCDLGFLVFKNGLLSISNIVVHIWEEKEWFDIEKNRMTCVQHRYRFLCKNFQEYILVGKEQSSYLFWNRLTKSTTIIIVSIFIICNV